MRCVLSPVPLCLPLPLLIPSSTAVTVAGSAAGAAASAVAEDVPAVAAAAFPAAAAAALATAPLLTEGTTTWRRSFACRTAGWVFLALSRMLEMLWGCVGASGASDGRWVDGWMGREGESTAAEDGQKPHRWYVRVVRGRFDLCSGPSKSVVFYSSDRGGENK